MISSEINRYKQYSPMAGALYDAKETLASGAALAKKNARLFFSTTNAAHQTRDLYALFTQTTQAASSASSAAEQFFLGASIGQAIYGIGRSGFGIYNCANSLKKGDIEGGIFHGFIYTPGKFAGSVTSSMRVTEEIVLLKAGQAASIFSTIGSVASLAQAVFLAISGVYQLYNACTFSQGFEETDNSAQYLFEQAFIQSEEKLGGITTEEELQDLLRQQKEAFIRRTNAECYNEAVKHYFNLTKTPDLKGDEVPAVNLKTLRSLSKNLNSLNQDLEKKVLQSNFQTKMVAVIKIIAAILAGTACITLLVFTGGLGLIAVASILLIITSLLRAGSNAPELHKAIGDFVWTYQQHRILPKRLSNTASNEKQQKAIQQVKFAALAVLGAATLPIWIVPAAIGFQIKGAWDRRHPVQTIPTDHS